MYIAQHIERNKNAFILKELLGIPTGTFTMTLQTTFSLMTIITFRSNNRYPTNPNIFIYPYNILYTYRLYKRDNYYYDV